MVVDAISKQKSIDFKTHYAENLLKVQKRLCKAVLLQQELDDEHWWCLSNQVNNLPCAKQVPDEIVFNAEVIDLINKDKALLDTGNQKINKSWIERKMKKLVKCLYNMIMHASFNIEENFKQTSLAPIGKVKA